MNPVQELERRFLDRLKEVRTRMATRYPAHEFEVWSSSTGSATDYQGHDLGIEAVFSDAQHDEANCVAVAIGVKHLTTQPTLDDLGLSWCSGRRPGADVDLLEEPLPYNDGALTVIEARFPRLIEAFEAAVDAWVGSRTTGE